MPRGSSPSHALSCTRYAAGRISSTLVPLARANMSPRARSGSSPGGTEETRSEPARLGDAVHELHARRIQPRGVTQLRERDERSRDLRRNVDPLGGIDANRQAIDEPVELTLGQGPQDVGQPVGCFRDA